MPGPDHHFFWGDGVFIVFVVAFIIIIIYRVSIGALFIGFFGYVSPNIGIMSPLLRKLLEDLSYGLRT